MHFLSLVLCLCVYTWMCTCLCVCVCEYMYTCGCTYMWCMCTCECMWMYMHVGECMHVCVLNTNMHACKCTYPFIQIHMWMSKKSLRYCSSTFTWLKQGSFSLLIPSEVHYLVSFQVSSGSASHLSVGMLGFQMLPAILGFWGSELRSLCFHGKHNAL